MPIPSVGIIYCSDSFISILFLCNICVQLSFTHINRPFVWNWLWASSVVHIGISLQIKFSYQVEYVFNEIESERSRTVFHIGDNRIPVAYNSFLHCAIHTSAVLVYIFSFLEYNWYPQRVAQSSLIFRSTGGSLCSSLRVGFKSLRLSVTNQNFLREK